MKSISGHETIAEMRIPKSWREPLILLVIYAIVVVGVVAAAFNLVCLRVMPVGVLAASGAWLLWIGVILRNACKREGGIRLFLLNRAGEFAPRQIAEIVKSASGEAMLCFGYDLFNRRFYCLKVRCDGIRSVKWSPGQATSLAGHDMKDWYVSVWFDREYVVVDTLAYKCDLHVVGPPRQRRQTEEFGNQFIEFLRGVGVAVAPLDNTALRNLIGRCGCTSSSLWAIGDVTIDAKQYRACSDRRFIAKGTRVKVVDAAGRFLIVRAAEKAKTFRCSD